MVTFCPFSKGLFVSFLSASYITSHATKCYLFSALGNIFEWYTSLLFKYLHSKCYFVTLLPRPFLRQHKRGWKNCKRAENQSYIKLDLKTIREQVAHDDNDNRCETLFTPISHSISQIAKQTRWPTATYVLMWNVKCEMQWFWVFGVGI